MPPPPLPLRSKPVGPAPGTQPGAAPSARTPQCYRFFFAIKPDEATAQRIDAFAAHEVPGGRRLKLDHQHVTLALTGNFKDYPDALIARLLAAGGEVEADAFDLTLDRLSANRRVVVLCPEHVHPPLYALQRAIVAAMARHDVPLREGYEFSPHQALCYRKGAPFQRPIAGFSWHADAFVLVQSFVGLSRHEVIGRWPLRLPAPPAPAP